MRPLCRRLQVFIVFIGAVAMLSLRARAGKPADDERVILFPTYARSDPETGTWQARAHGWVFEPEGGSLTRKAFLGVLRRAMRLSAEDEQKALFKKRMGAFVVDNERGKKFSLILGEHAFKMEKSGANGHFFGDIKCDDKGDQVILSLHGRESVKGTVDVIPPTGVSVISDIDDTIKISNVLDRKALLANTFIREFKPVPGMAEAYAAWHKQGARFHYVTSSPWQLYEPLADLLRTRKFPLGSFHMKYFRVKDRTVANLLADPEKAKIGVISAIMKDFPKRKFLLVGDSGERDPNVYAHLARTRPEQVLHIYIRAVKPEHAGKEALADVFGKVDAAKWTVFQKASELPQKPGQSATR